MEGWGRTPVRSADAPGFIVNRVNRAFTLEPLAALEAGEASVAAIDRAARDAGYPMGPFELMDLIGLDVNLAVSTALHVAAVAAGDPLAERFRPSALQAELVRPAVSDARPEAGSTPAGGADSLALTATEASASRPLRRPRRSSNGPGSRSSSRRIGRSAMGSPRPPTSTSRCDSAPAIRSVRSSAPPRWAVPAVLDRLARKSALGPRFVPAPALVAAAAVP